jgi:hypothetical protein
MNNSDNNVRSTFGKATLSSRLNNIIHHVDQIRNSKKPLNLSNMFAEVQSQLQTLKKELDADLVEETTILFDYNQETFNLALNLLRKKIRERFVHFPMAAALAEQTLMLVEMEIDMTAQFTNLRKVAGIEERTGPSKHLYGLNGEPKA